MHDVLAHVRRWRAPMTLIVVAVMIGRAILAGVRIGMDVAGGDGLGEALVSHHTSLVSLPALIVLLLLVAANVWARPRLDNARGLAVLAATVAGVVVGLALVAGIVGIALSGLDALMGLLAGASLLVWSVVPLLLCAGLVAIARGLGTAGRLAGGGPDADRDEAASTAGEDPDAEGQREDTGARLPETAPDDPVWQPHEAAGAAWTSASAAAQGADAVQWGQDTGWGSGQARIDPAPEAAPGQADASPWSTEGEPPRPDARS